MIKINIQLFGGRGQKSNRGSGSGGGVALNVSTNNPRKISVNELNKLMSVAIQNEPKITKDLQSIVSKTNGTINYDVGDGKTSLDFRIKTSASLERKINTDLQEKSKDEVLNTMYDVVRYTDLVDEDNFVNDYEQITKELETKGYKIKRVKNTFNDDTKEYKGLNTVVENPEGYKFELQFHTPKSLEIKEINHKLYEEQRLESTSIERKQELNRMMKANSEKINHIPRIDNIKNLDELKIKTQLPSQEKLNSTSSNYENLIDRKYYDIDEKMARYGHDMFSMREYKENSQTIHYKTAVNEIYDLADETIQKCKDDPDKQSYIKKKADQYAKQYAEWINKDSQLKLKYPSQMITGSGGWTSSMIQKKENAFNAHYKKLEEINKIKEDIENTPHRKQKVEKQGVAINEDRYKSEHFKVVQNESENRLQLVFDEKPDEATRNLLKHHGFKWSPKNQVWQRQLTANARYSTKLLDEQLTKLKDKK